MSRSVSTAWTNETQLYSVKLGGGSKMVYTETPTAQLMFPILGFFIFLFDLR